MKKLRVTLLILIALSLIALIFFVKYKMVDEPQMADPELKKLAVIWSSIDSTDLRVIHDGVEFPAQFAILRGQKYLRTHFKKGTTAREWIEEYTYRSKKGEVAYFKYADDTMRPMRDVFIEALEKMEGTTTESTSENKKDSTSQLQAA